MVDGDEIYIHVVEEETDYTFKTGTKRSGNNRKSPEDPYQAKTPSYVEDSMEGDSTPQYRSTSMATCCKKGGTLGKMGDMAGIAVEKYASDRVSYDDTLDIAYCGTSWAAVDKKGVGYSNYKNGWGRHTFNFRSHMLEHETMYNIYGPADEAQVINSLMGPETPCNAIGGLAFGLLQEDEIRGGYSHVGQMKSMVNNSCWATEPAILERLECSKQGAQVKNKRVSAENVNWKAKKKSMEDILNISTKKNT
ncbi:hypothetical protein Ancab_033690 [Ancistrocladus abbreviatus]